MTGGLILGGQSQPADDAIDQKLKDQITGLFRPAAEGTYGLEMVPVRRLTYFFPELAHVVPRSITGFYHADIACQFFVFPG
jgi:hypothetical protein